VHGHGCSPSRWQRLYFSRCRRGRGRASDLGHRRYSGRERCGWAYPRSTRRRGKQRAASDRSDPAVPALPVGIVVERLAASLSDAAPVVRRAVERGEQWFGAHEVLVVPARQTLYPPGTVSTPAVPSTSVADVVGRWRSAARPYSAAREWAGSPTRGAALGAVGHRAVRCGDVAHGPAERPRCCRGCGDCCAYLAVARPLAASRVLGTRSRRWVEACAGRGALGSPRGWARAGSGSTAATADVVGLVCRASPAIPAMALGSLEAAVGSVRRDRPRPGRARVSERCFAPADSRRRSRCRRRTSVDS